jgi:hypothetical protein
MIENLEVWILNLSTRKYFACHCSFALCFKTNVHLLHLKTNCQIFFKEIDGLLSSNFDDLFIYNKTCQMLIVGMIFKQMNKVSMIMGHMSYICQRIDWRLNYL